MLALHNIFNGVWLMDNSTALNYIPFVVNYMKGVQSDTKLPAPKNSYFLENGNCVEELGKNEKGVMVISIFGAMTKHNQTCGPRGMVYVAQQLREAYADDNIVGVILKIESGGGEANAYSLVREVLQERNKPVVAFIDDIGASAAYGVATNTDYIVANSKNCMIGSIGAYFPLADFSKKLKKDGIKLVDIYAPQSTKKNQEYREFIKGNYKPYEDLAKHFCADFIENVSQTRGDKLTSNEWDTGELFFATKAKEIGLIDEINTFSNILNYFTF